MANLASTIITGSLLVTGQTSGSDAKFNTITASLGGTASYALSASYAPQAQNISVNSITASYISASNIVTVTPTAANQVATKQYVDNINPQGLNFYFRSASADITGYKQMLQVTTPISSSTQNIVVAAASASQYIYSFITPALGVTSIQQGSVNVHYHAYISANGAPGTNTIIPELYLRSASVEIQLPAASPDVLTANSNSDFTTPILLTSSLSTNLTDRLICKFKIGNGASTPDVTFGVEGSTAAGIIVPVASSNFILKTGDVMTGNLTVPQVIGTASWANNSISSSHALTASYALNSTSGGTTLTTGSTYPITSSWAVNAINLIGSITSASYAGTASLLLGSIQSASFATNAATASYYNQLWLVTGSTYPITSSWAINALSASYAPPPTDIDIYAVSASWVSASVKITNSDTASYISANNLPPHTSSWSDNSISSSYALTASYALNSTAGGTTLETGSTYPITSSWAEYAVNFTGTVVSSSYSQTASYAMNGGGSVAGFEFNISSSINAITTEVVVEHTTASYNAAFFHYVAINGENKRAGVISTTWNETTIVYNETCTTDLGDTTDLVMSVDLLDNLVRLKSTSTTNTYNVIGSGQYI